MKKSSILLGTYFVLFSSTQAATLNVQSISVNPGPLPKNAVRVPFVSLNLQAQDGDITIESLTVERSGLSSNQDFGRIWAETSNYRRTQARRLSNDDQVELSFRNGLNLAKNETIRLYVYANLEFSGSGRTARLDLVGIQHNGDEPETQTQALDKIRVSQSKRRYDKSKYRIKCTRGKCRLVPRD